MSYVEACIFTAFFSCGKKPKLAALDFLAGGHCRKVLGLQGLAHKMAPPHKMAPLNLASGMRASGQHGEDMLLCSCAPCPALSPACCSREWFQDTFLGLDLLVLKAGLVPTPFRCGVPCLSYTCGATSSMISVLRCSQGAKSGGLRTLPTSLVTFQCLREEMGKGPQQGLAPGHCFSSGHLYCKSSVPSAGLGAILLTTQEQNQEAPCTREERGSGICQHGYGCLVADMPWRGPKLVNDCET